jgi:hypothetical protein
MTLTTVDYEGSGWRGFGLWVRNRHTIANFGFFVRETQIQARKGIAFLRRLTMHLITHPAMLQSTETKN